jgi:hypothetical protein
MSRVAAAGPCPRMRWTAMSADRHLDPLGAGNSTGRHLHFEQNLGGGREPVEPAGFLAGGDRFVLDVWRVGPQRVATP